MYVRLGFAVAAHIDSEILIIDEVLAVGDVEFQKKSAWKIGGGGKGGRTVLMVSYNLQTVVSLCSRALVLDAGGIICDEKTRCCSFIYTCRPVGVGAGRHVVR